MKKKSKRNAVSIIVGIDFALSLICGNNFPLNARDR